MLARRPAALLAVWVVMFSGACAGPAIEPGHQPLPTTTQSTESLEPGDDVTERMPSASSEPDPNAVASSAQDVAGSVPSVESPSPHAFAAGDESPGGLSGWGGLAASDEFVKVFVDEHTTCALRGDGRVLCWPFPESDSPLRQFGEVVDMDFGYPGVCVVSSDGSLECLWWIQAQTPPEGEFIAVGVGFRDACAIKVGGALECWGVYRHHSADEMNGSSASMLYSSLDIAHVVACAVSVEGRVWCSWFGSEFEPESPPGRVFKAVTVGGFMYAGFGPAGGSSAGAMTLTASRRRPPARSWRCMRARRSHAGSAPPGRSSVGASRTRNPAFLTGATSRVRTIIATRSTCVRVGTVTRYRTRLLRLSTCSRCIHSMESRAGTRGGSAV